MMDILAGIVVGVMVLANVVLVLPSYEGVARTTADPVRPEWIPLGR